MDEGVAKHVSRTTFVGIPNGESIRKESDPGFPL